MLDLVGNDPIYMKSILSFMTQFQCPREDTILIRTVAEVYLVDRPTELMYIWIFICQQTIQKT